MILVTEDSLMEKFDSLPTKLREILESKTVFDRVEKIATDHNLSDDEEEILKIYTGYVLFGFLPPQELLNEVGVYLSISDKMAFDVVHEISRIVFYPIQSELDALYQPVDLFAKHQPTTEMTTGQGTDKNIVLSDIGNTNEEPIPIEKAVTLKEQKTDAPFILHEEKVPEGNIMSKTVFRSVTAPLGGFFFKKKQPAAGETKTPFAKLEIPGIKPEEKRVVHYSETRTPLASLEEPAFLNLGEEKPLVRPETISPQRESKEVEPPTGGSTSIIGTIKKPEPKIEGNTIDLSNG